MTEPAPAAPFKFKPSRPVHVSAQGLWEFTPEGLKKMDPPPVFYIHIPTYAQRDSLSQLLYATGCMPVTVEHGRSVLISELYEVYDPDPENAPPRKVEVEVYNEEDPDNPIVRLEERPKLLGDPDEMASFMEGYFQRLAIYEQLILDWGAQEKERLVDQMHGAEAVEGMPIPPAPYSPREAVRATRISMDMLELSPSYRRLQSQHADYETREDLMLFRLFCAGWDGLRTKPAFLKSGPLGEATVEKLRQELARLDRQNPNQYWLEVVHEIRQLMHVDKELEKNSASPLGNDSSPNGSDARSEGSDDGDGAWTGSTTGPAPASESPQTSATSSSSQSRPSAPKKKRGRTAKP